jgi:2-hydroxychromene-2-carboxylate isomerase
MSTATPTQVEFWFDPSCPFTWATSRWAREVADGGAAQVHWKVMSLGILNEGAEIPEQYREAMNQAARMLRVLAAVHGQEGPDGGSAAVGRLYQALGRRLHDEGRSGDPDVVTEALEEAGLPATLAAAADDEAFDAEVRRSHEESQARVGDDAGSPVTAYDGGPAYFGPVVAPAPTGEQARTLLTAMTALSAVPAFAEIKRSRGAL